MQRIGKVAYKLQLPEGTLLHDVFPVNQLKKHLGPAAVPNARLPLLTTEGKIKTAPLADCNTVRYHARLAHTTSQFLSGLYIGTT